MSKFWAFLVWKKAQTYTKKKKLLFKDLHINHQNGKRRRWNCGKKVRELATDFSCHIFHSSLFLSLSDIFHSSLSLSLTLTFTETLGIEKHRQVAIEHPITIYTKYIDIDVEYL